MSESTQAIFFLIAFVAFCIAAFVPPRPWGYVHPGWLGAASIALVLFWIAVKAS